MALNGAKALRALSVGRDRIGRAESMGLAWRLEPPTVKERGVTTRLDPRNRWLLHFTHVDNLPSIVAAGRFSCDGQAGQGLLKKEVGDVEIKEIRRRRPVTAGPGGSVGDYVPFYFAPRSPMMFRIACDHRDAIPGRYPDGDRPLAYLATTVGAIIDAGLAWVATDGNAATATTRFIPDLDDLNLMVDWPLMRSQMWNNTSDDPDRQRRRWRSSSCKATYRLR